MISTSSPIARAVIGKALGDSAEVRRLVAALVQRVARHTKHGLQRPKIGVHACARGKEGCPYCRYGFPHQRLPRGGMVMEKGEREGQWHARFPRNDRMGCNYEPHVLLANMGNIDWRPVLNLGGGAVRDEICNEGSESFSEAARGVEGCGR